VVDVGTNARLASHRNKKPRQQKALNVLLADDHAIVRAGLKQVLQDGLDVELIGEASDAYEMLNKLQEQDWDVVLLDINMPGKSGLEILKQIKREQPKLAVLILSIHSEDQYALRALKAGAAGYLTKACIPEELVAAVRKVAGGGKYITSNLAEKLAHALDPGIGQAPHELLSDRELQIFELLASGKKVSVIARELSLSTKTVSTHRANSIPG